MDTGIRARGSVGYTCDTSSGIPECCVVPIPTHPRAEVHAIACAYAPLPLHPMHSTKLMPIDVHQAEFLHHVYTSYLYINSAPQLILFFFFLMIRRPPKFPLFPTATLFR